MRPADVVVPKFLKLRSTVPHTPKPPSPGSAQQFDDISSDEFSRRYEEKELLGTGTFGRVRYWGPVRSESRLHGCGSRVSLQKRAPAALDSLVVAHPRAQVHRALDWESGRHVAVKRFWTSQDVDKPSDALSSKARSTKHLRAGANAGRPCLHAPTLRRNRADAVEQEATILNELKILSLLSLRPHDNVAALLAAYRLDVGSTGSSYTLVMEFVNGGELFTAANAFTFSEVETAHVIAEVLQGVECVETHPT